MEVDALIGVNPLRGEVRFENALVYLPEAAIIVEFALPYGES